MSSNNDNTETYEPFVESHPDEGADVLRSRMEADGYLFFRGLVPADEVLAVRRDVLTLCAEAGWLDPSRDLMDGIVAPTCSRRPRECPNTWPCTGACSSSCRAFTTFRRCPR
jgi:hypothetical protein